MEEVLAIVLMGNGNELLEIARSNTFDQSILGFCHSVPHPRSRSDNLRSGLTIQPCCGIRHVG